MSEHSVLEFCTHPRQNFPVCLSAFYMTLQTNKQTNKKFQFYQTRKKLKETERYEWVLGYFVCVVGKQKGTQKKKFFVASFFFLSLKEVLLTMSFVKTR